MNGKIENKDGKIIFTYANEEYKLSSHPYEPCLYIYKNEEMIKILHNAFDVDDLIETFENGDTVKAPDSEEYDREAFIEVLISAINDDRYEMNWTYAARTAKFKYGTDINVYLKKAVELLKEEHYYHWADQSQFHKQYRYAVEKEDEQYHFVRYTTFSDDDIEREVLDVEPLNSFNLITNGEEFIRLISIDNELSVYYANPKILNYKIMFKQGLEIDHWYLERYEFNKHKTGDYSAFVQAGDSTTGSSREFFIPPYYLEGTYEEFLDKYQTLVPGDQFGLFKEDLINDEGLKKFLGF